MNFCNTCKKIVPDKEIKSYSYKKKVILKHEYQEYVNINGYVPGNFNFCGGYRAKYCGDIVEPTEEEYFIYITCQK